MSSREGRGRPRRDYPARSEEKSAHSRGNNPPSRHLWVGNLSHDLTESDLAHFFLRYGDLESLAFQPGRSYAFVNYKNDEEAFIAVKELQGFFVAGNPLRIEFAKAEKSSNPPRDRRDEPHPMSRDSPYNQRDSRARNSSSSSEPRQSNKSRMNDEDAEPSEVLWIGFPAQLKVDEFILRKAFSPFGEIEKITAFPGRTYAFVRYRNVIAARRAKETLHGKLFGNPRVHICFAKNESGPSNRERNYPINAPPSPRAGSYGRPGSSEYFRSDRNDLSRRSPDFIPNLDPSHRSDTRFSGNIYEHQYSPPRDVGARFREPSPLKFRPFYDDPWDLPEDVSLSHGTKKLKTDSYSPENELPEYPFSDLEKAKHVPLLNIPQSSILDNNFDPRLSGQRFKHDHLMERVDHWNPSIENFHVNSSPLLPPHDHRRLTPPDSRESSSKQVWRWEGMIAKGGTPVCRARCFPVGKQMDFILPKYIDCTARTSLEMLAEHYYQAASAWVVFFVPANDPDIGYYNEFMNFLGEKQRAAVAKLDERTTLFLVPPSDFSEKVLKVPGKLSISGVVLRLDPQSSNQNREATHPHPSFQSDAFYHKPISPSQPYLPPPPPFTNYQKPAGNLSSMHNMQSVDAQGHDYVQKPPVGPIWPIHDSHNSNLTPRNYTSQAPSTVIGSMGHHTYTAMPRQMQESTHNNYPVEVPTSRQPSLQTEQLAQLASSLLGQPSQSGGMSTTGENNNQFGYSFQASQNYGLPNNQVSSEFTQTQFGQMQQSTAPQVNQNAGQEEDAEADPQKRLQATLQLAAALLQQIQQGKGN
ncbi:hypothetical protein ACJIZ3_010554 [Penstemon smallii]|uniref:RRM domain-containing protein n=1 Tax=Penstemon smallii TaxID=265156 RepID=A0ABD3UGQ9_9LAMI